MRLTLRAVLGSSAIVVLIVGLVSLVVFSELREELTQQTDAELEQLTDRPLILFVRPADVLARSRGPAGAVRTTPALAAIGDLPDLPLGYRTVTVGGRDLRVFTRLSPTVGRLSVARDVTATQRTVDHLGRLMLIAGVVAAALGTAALVLVMRAALAPVRRTAAVAEAVAVTSDLSRRVAGGERADELGRLVSAVNRMLDRLETSDAALRRFVGDASHELRTPVTTLRGNVELLMADTAMDPGERALVLDDTHDEILRMQSLVDDMLALARAEGTPREHQRVAVSDIVDGANAGLVVIGDRDALTRLVRNLVENAERYAGGGSVSADRHDGAVRIRVVDRGPGIPAELRDRIFDRFARGDADQGTPGTGLGLAIVQGIARAHGGDARIEDTPGGGATVVVTLPVAPQDQAGSG